MPKTQLDSRGYFWREGEVVPDGQFAPSRHVPGRLELTDTGHIRLHLDGALPSDDPHDAMKRMFRRGPVDGAIAGILVGTDERVLLTDLSDRGGNIRFEGPSIEIYTARRALVGKDLLLRRDQRFRWLELPLDGFEQWLDRGNIEMEIGKRAHVARYRHPKQLSWPLADGRLDLVQGLEGAFQSRDHEVHWSEFALLRLRRQRGGFNVDEALDLAARVEELLMLLTDSRRGLDFPILRTRKAGPPVRIYFSRAPRTKQAVQWDNCWALFRQCDAKLGELLDAWLEQHERFGPGFHLYLGNRRAQTLYPEHRFASLVWGLESLSRTLHPPRRNQKLTEKVQRILSQIDAEKDRNWAARNLPTEDEISLATRIATEIRALPLALKSAEVDDFAKRCAARRNDVSHFGGRREAGGYDRFVEDIQIFSRALELLYHARILQLTGVSDELLAWWFVDGFNSYWMSQSLSAAGLSLAVTTRGGHGPSA